MQKRFGLFYFTSEQPSAEQTIDLVAIHGLGGDYERTWTDEESEKNWLRDFLPQKIPQLRVMSWGYNSALISKSVLGIDSFAEALMGDVRRARENELQKRPLIFVCHSLGGLVLKRALVFANERRGLHGPTLDAVQGVAFLGTPHNGSGIASCISCIEHTKIAKLWTLGKARDELVKTLKKDDKKLFEYAKAFRERGGELKKICSFYEGEKMPFGFVVREHFDLLCL